MVTFNSFKKISWQDWIFFCSLIFFSVYYFYLFSSFHQFPSEYYGGDHYAHFSSALKIYDTYNPFISSHYYNELQHYPWLVPLLIAIFALVTGQGIFKAAIFFPALIIFFTLIITYIFGNWYFKNKTFGLILALSWLVQLVPSFHPSEFAKQLMIPLLALFILLLFELSTKKRILAAGLIFGLAGLQHAVTLFVSIFIFISVFFFKMLEKRDIKRFFIVAVFGFAIASLFWMPLLVKYHGKTLNEWQVYTSQSLFPSQEFVSSMFLELIGYQKENLSILAIAAVFFVIIYSIINADKKIFVPILLAAAALLGIIHPYITYPLFNFTIGYYRFPIVFVFVKHLLIITAAYYLWTLTKEKIISKKNLQEETKRWISVIAFALVLLWISVSFLSMINNYKKSERYEYAIAEDEKITAYLALRAFIEKNNIIKDEVTLTIHPDIGFFFNAMTGKNVMVSRITHAIPFVEHNKRTADMAVLLYGNDSSKAQEIIKEYNIRYFFSETSNIRFGGNCVKNWNETKYSSKKDKTTNAYWCILTEPLYKDYLAAYGIETATADVRLAAGDKDVPLTTVLAVKPKKITLPTEEIYSYTGQDGNVILRLYRIKAE